MLDFWVVYDAATGRIGWTGSGPAGMGGQQQAPSGMAILVNPSERAAACATHRVDLGTGDVVAIDSTGD